MFNLERRPVRMIVWVGIALLLFVALAALRYYLHGRDAGTAAAYAGAIVGTWAALFGWVALLGWWLPRWAARGHGPLGEVADSEMGVLYFASGTLGLAVWAMQGITKVTAVSSPSPDVFGHLFLVGVFFPLLLELSAPALPGILRCLLLIHLEAVGAVAVLAVRIVASTPAGLVLGIPLALILVVGAVYGILRVAASFARHRAGSASVT